MLIVLLVFLLPVAALATWQAVEIWNHGSLFSDWRRSCAVRTEIWWCRLLDCMFCLSNWVAMAVWIPLLLAVSWDPWCGLPVLALATARLANWANDKGHSFCRTPREDGHTWEADNQPPANFETQYPVIESGDFHA